jgi:hypothetical protein
MLSTSETASRKALVIFLTSASSNSYSCRFERFPIRAIAISALFVLLSASSRNLSRLAWLFFLQSCLCVHVCKCQKLEILVLLIWIVRAIRPARGHRGHAKRSKRLFAAAEARTAKQDGEDTARCADAYALEDRLIVAMRSSMKSLPISSGWKRKSMTRSGRAAAMRPLRVELAELRISNCELRPPTPSCAKN